MSPELQQVDFSHEANQKIIQSFHGYFQTQILSKSHFDHPVEPSFLEVFLSPIDDEPVVIKTTLKVGSNTIAGIHYFVGEKTARRLEREGALVPNRKGRRLLQSGSHPQNAPLKRV